MTRMWCYRWLGKSFVDVPPTYRLMVRFTLFL